MLPIATGADLGPDGRLQPAAAAVEAEDLALRVVSARLFRLPYARVRARLSLQSPRRFNILEEFVLRAAAELQPPPTPAELASLLGLDPLFVDSTLAHLEELKTVSRGKGGAITLTATGKRFYEQGQVPQAAEHKNVSLLYRGVLDELLPWQPPPAADDLPVLPGVGADAREALAQQAQAAVTPKRLAGTLTQGQTLTAVDQIAVEDLGYYAVGILLVQDTSAEPGADNVSLRAVDLNTHEPDAALQRWLDEGLSAGRVSLSDFIEAALDDGDEAELDADAEAPDYAERYRQNLAAARKRGRGGRLEGGVALLRAGSAEAASDLLRRAEHSALLLLPRLTEANAGAALRRDVEALAARHVLTVVGWGTAGARDDEPYAPASGVVDGLHGLLTPDGLPAAPVWWVGELYGQDLILDQASLISSLPNPLQYKGQRVPGGSATYLVTDPDLVSTVVEDVEPSFARAARLAWHAAARSPLSTSAALERCCVTWVAIRRPGEALSHILKLASGEPENMPVAWALLAATCLALARLPAAALTAMNALEPLRRAIPEFLDWAESAAPARRDDQPPFLAAFHDLLSRASGQDEHELPGVLAEARRLWLELGLPNGPRPTNVIAAPPEERKAERLSKKRRY